MLLSAQRRWPGRRPISLRVSARGSKISATALGVAKTGQAATNQAVTNQAVTSKGASNRAQVETTSGAGASAPEVSN